MRDRETAVRNPGLKTDRPVPGWAAGLFILAAVLAAYSNALEVPFLFDDGPSIPGNPSLSNFWAALQPPILRTVSGRPFLNLTLALNHALGGTHVLGYHIFNLCVHSAASLTLFAILRRVFRGSDALKGDSVALCATLLWALHPLHTSAVTYVVQRAESLMGLLFLLTLYCFIRGSEAGSRRPVAWYACCVAACALGMATKEVMVAAPLVILAFDCAFCSTSLRDSWRIRRRVHLSLAATWILLAVLVVSTRIRSSSAVPIHTPGAWPYLVTQSAALVRYLRLCVWPVGLVFDYGNRTRPFDLVTAADGLAVLSLLAATVWSLGKHPKWAFLGVWFFLILAPTSSILPVAGETMAEYRMYLPSVAVAVALTLVIFRLIGRWAPLLVVAVAALLAWGTHERNEVYSSETSLWRDTVQQWPLNFRAHGNLAGALSKIPGNESEVLSEYQEAVLLDPAAAEARVDLGNALSVIPGGLAEAEEQYRTAIQLEPRLAGAHVGLGNVLSTLPGGLSEAVNEYERALELDPTSAQVHFNVGNALIRIPERLGDAIGHYREATRLAPGMAKAHFGLAVALLRAGDTESAARELEKGLRISPNDARAREILEGLVRRK